MRKRTGVTFGAVGLAAFALTAVIYAHPDDPKAKDREPKYEGPGYREALQQQKGAGLPNGPGDDFDSLGVQLRAWLPINDFGFQHDNANDCWGYVSQSGREYALLGLSHGTGIVEITEPGNPQIIDMIDGPDSLWRDVKVYQDYAYVVTEGWGAGIQVIDLSQADDGIVSLVNTINDGGVESTHNVAIDTDSGFLYRTGGDNNGLRIYDLADPVNPQFVGSWTLRYVHDAQVVTFDDGPYAGRQIAFCCSGFNYGWTDTGLDILDVTDKDNIQHLGQLLYDNGQYSHQAWLSEDRQLLYLNDELDEDDLGIPTTTIVIDVSDLENPSEVGRFDNGNSAIGHNIYVRDDLIFEANYRSGLRIFDASDDPVNAVEVAYFDTYTANDNSSFNGLWSNYPFFPSGTVIGSDMEKGLFVWTVDALQKTPGDVTEDGVVDINDLFAVLNAWGPCGGCVEDLTDDGMVNIDDLFVVLNNWG
jgi:choice-of-anchor B domain-containing protein